MADDIKTPHPVDVYAGGRVRLARKQQGISQTDLAEALGLTFQQVQKYERGANRISASKMYEIAKTLKLPVGYFYPPLDDAEYINATGEADLAAAVAEIGQDVVIAFSKLPRVDRRLVGEVISRWSLAGAEPEVVPA